MKTTQKIKLVFSVIFLVFLVALFVGIMMTMHYAHFGWRGDVQLYMDMSFYSIIGLLVCYGGFIWMDFAEKLEEEMEADK